MLGSEETSVGIESAWILPGFSASRSGRDSVPEALLVGEQEEAEGASCLSASCRIVAGEYEGRRVKLLHRDR